MENTSKKYLIFGSNYSKNCKELVAYFLNYQSEQFEFTRFKSKERLEELTNESIAKTIIIFVPIDLLENNDEIDYLISISNILIFISTNSEQYFTDCLLERKTKHEASSLWPKYTQTAEIILNSIQKKYNKSEFFIIDNYFEYAFESIIDCITTNNNIKLDRDILLNKSILSELIKEELKEKNNQEIHSLFYRQKVNLFNSFRKFILEWIKGLASGNFNQRLEVIDEILEKYEHRHFMNPEEKSTLKNLIVNQRGSQGTVSSLLIESSLLILKHLKTNQINSQQENIIDLINEQLESNKNENLQRIISILDIFHSICMHHIFSHEIFNDLNFLKLINELFHSPYYVLKMRATYLIKQMLDKDHKRYGSMIHESEKGKPSNESFVQLIIKLIFKLCKPLLAYDDYDENDSRIEQVLSDYEKFIDDNLVISALELLLKGSNSNCKHVHVNDLKELSNHAVKSLFHVHSVRIFSVLNNLLKYGSFSDWNKYVDVAQLLKRANTEIIHLSLNRANSMLWKRTTEFYKNLLVMLENNEQFIEEDDTDDHDLNNKKTETQEPDLKSYIIETKKFNKNLVESFYSFKVKLRDKAEQQPLKIIKDQEELISVCFENKELQLHNEELKTNLKESEVKVQDLKLEIEKQENEKNARIEECIKLRASIVANAQVLETKLNENNKLEVSVTDEDDLFLKQVEEARIELDHQIARKFIQILGKKRANLKDFRKQICGIIKQLSLNLYTSPTHFLSEIIQNQEDCTFDKSEKPWFMKLVIHSEYLMFCSNENGFRVTDILAITSLSESFKKKGQQIGHKGLGFKSVFVCSDTPMIVSSPWQFKFNKNSSNDELAYITPEYLDTAQFPPDLSVNIDENKNCNTFIYLPLNEKYKKLNNDILTSVNHFVLIFTKNIETIIIEDKINLTQIEMKCTKKQEKFEKNVQFLQSHFNTIEISNCFLNIRKQNSKNNEIENLNLSLYSCECKLSIPDDLIKEEDLNTNETTLTLAFPINDDSTKSFPIFAFLPVYNIGFKFIINSYWSLTTNRESINENAMINRYYRDHLSNFFVWLANNESIVKNGIYNYLPKKREIKQHSDWWQSFIDDISTKIRPLLNSLITSSNQAASTDNHKCLTRISNSKLDDLIDEKILDLIGINLIKPNSQLNEADLELYGFEKLTLKDILFKCFNSKFEYKLIIKDWKQSRNGQWWEKLFRLFYIESISANNNMLNEIKNLEIFLVQIVNADNIKQRTYLSSNVKYFYSDNKSVKYWWNSSLKLINSESIAEKNFILDVLKLPVLTIEEIVELIYMKHMTHTEKDQLHKTIWLDLEFIKDNFYGLLKDGLNLPLKFDNNLLFPARICSISSILGINLTELPVKKRCFFIDFNNFSKQLIFKKILEWENFLIDICSLPIIDFDKLDKLPIFQDLNSLDKESCKLACKILDKIQDSVLLKTIQNLSIQSPFGLTKLNHLCINNICLNLIPSIQVPEYSIGLCRRLGIIVDLNFDTCFKCLKTMVENQNNDPEAYLQWLIKLKSFTINDNNEIRKNYESQSFIRLKNVNNDEYDSFKASQIYICDTNTSVFSICKYTKKTMINLNYNITFKPMESLFISLGSFNKPQIDHLIEAIDFISKDKNLFINNSFQNFLTNDAYQDLKELYIQLEECLVEKLKKSFDKKLKNYNLDEREQLATNKHVQELLSENQIQLLKIITYDQHLMNYNEFSHEKIYCCFNSFLLTNLKPRLKNTCIFIDSKIADECPLITSFIKPNYLQSILKIGLEHAANNPEKTNKFLNKAFSQATNLNIEVLKCKYVNISCWLNEQTEINRSNLIWHEIRFCIFNKNIVVCAETASDQANLSVYVKALKTLLRSIHPDQDETILEIEAKTKILEIKDYLNKQNWYVSEHAYSSGSKFNLNDVIFSDDDFDSNQFNEIYFSSGNELSTSSSKTSTAAAIQPDFKRKYIDRNYIKDEYTFDIRVDKLDKKILVNDTNLNNINNRNNSAAGNYVNTEAQKRIGIKAEHFFCRFLKSKYGESFNEYENWKSSARNHVYPSTSVSFDDRLGYDFIIKDYLNLFSSEHDKTSKLCFIEVKGTSGEWDGTFHITQNELNKKDELKKNESYIIVIVEFVDSYEQIKIARIINFSNDPDIITLHPEQYLATYTPRQYNNRNQNNPSRQTINWVKKIRPESNRYSNNSNNNLQGDQNDSRQANEWNRSNNYRNNNRRKN